MNCEARRPAATAKAITVAENRTRTGDEPAFLPWCCQSLNLCCLPFGSALAFDNEDILCYFVGCSITLGYVRFFPYFCFYSPLSARLSRYRFEASLLITNEPRPIDRLRTWPVPDEDNCEDDAADDVEAQCQNTYTLTHTRTYIYARPQQNIDKQIYRRPSEATKARLVLAAALDWCLYEVCFACFASYVQPNVRNIAYVGRAVCDRTISDWRLSKLRQ